MSTEKEFMLHCPILVSRYPHITMAHGGGGKLSHRLIEEMFLPVFQNKALDERHDGAVVEMNGSRLAFSTDSYVVHPLFFPGGDIGSMAVYGTVNDIAMCGAKPLYLSAGFIVEEGFKTETLARIVHSMGEAAKRCSVQIVTGDLKVVDRGKGDGVYINTSGVGSLRAGSLIAPQYIQSGDQILLNGDIGRHGMAIMAAREGLSFDSQIASDSAPLSGLVQLLLDEKIEVRCMRDLTRGGLSSALNEIAQARGVDMQIREKDVAVREDVRAACEIFGLDPFYVANEGRFIAFVSSKDAKRALSLIRSYADGQEAAIIGEVAGSSEGMVTLKNRIGTHRILDMLTGEQLPRIC